MKVTAIETIRSAEHPNLLWVEVMTDEGIVGVGDDLQGRAVVLQHPIADRHLLNWLAGAIGHDNQCAGCKACAFFQF